MEKTTNWKSNNSNGHKLQICWKNGKERLFKNKCQVKSKMCRKPQLRIGKKNCAQNSNVFKTNWKGENTNKKEVMISNYNSNMNKSSENLIEWKKQNHLNNQ